MKLYGIKNCDKAREKRKSLDNSNTAYEFIDLKEVSLSITQVEKWLQQCPDTLVNKRSTTYRQIKNDWVAATSNMNAQAHLTVAYPTVIKRPLIEDTSGKITIG